MASLEKELYSIANKIVGNVGPSTIVTKAATGEPYVSFAFRTDNIDKIKNVWIKWIKSYVAFAKFAKPECAKIDNGPELTVFWRRKPEIREHGSEVIVFSRLLISRYDPKSRVAAVLEPDEKLGDTKSVNLEDVLWRAIRKQWVH